MEVLLLDSIPTHCNHFLFGSPHTQTTPTSNHPIDLPQCIHKHLIICVLLEHISLDLPVLHHHTSIQLTHVVPLSYHPSILCSHHISLDCINTLPHISIQLMFGLVEQLNRFYAAVQLLNSFREYAFRTQLLNVYETTQILQDLTSQFNRYTGYLYMPYLGVSLEPQKFLSLHMLKCKIDLL